MASGSTLSRRLEHGHLQLLLPSRPPQRTTTTAATSGGTRDPGGPRVDCDLGEPLMIGRTAPTLAETHGGKLVVYVATKAYIDHTRV